MRILAIDPGLSHPACAQRAAGMILRAERLKVPAAWAKLDMLDRCERIGRAALEWWCAGPLVGAPEVVIVEWPQWYGDNVQGIDPNDLAGLCGIAGAAAAHVRARWRMHNGVFEPAIDVCSPKPREVWGNVPKATKGNPWASPRGRQLAARVTPEERANIQSKHDALDAAALAMFADGTWARRRVLPGAV